MGLSWVADRQGSSAPEECRWVDSPDLVLRIVGLLADLANIARVEDLWMDWSEVLKAADMLFEAVRTSQSAAGTSSVAQTGIECLGNLVGCTLVDHLGTEAVESVEAGLLFSLLV
jgi:hypothetical protein